MLNSKFTQSFLIFITISYFLSSCSLTNNVISSKKFQKRKYQKGFYIQHKSKTPYHNRNIYKPSKNYHSVLSNGKHRYKNGLKSQFKKNEKVVFEKIKAKKNQSDPLISHKETQESCGYIDSFKKEISNHKTQVYEENEEEIIREKNAKAWIAAITTLIAIPLIPFTLGIILLPIACYLSIKANPSSKDGQKFSQLAKISFYVSLSLMCILLIFAGLIVSIVIAFFAGSGAPFGILLAILATLLLVILLIHFCSSQRTKYRSKN